MAYVRIADARDAEEVARLLVAFRDFYDSDWPSANAFLAVVERLMDDRKTEFLLGSTTEAGPPQAVCQLRFRLSVWTAADDCWVEDLFVSEEARGSGLGAAMIEASFERARVRGCRRIELDVDAGNEPAVGLYTAKGFQQKHVAHGGAILMARSIEEDL